MENKNIEAERVESRTPGVKWIPLFFWCKPFKTVEKIALILSAPLTLGILPAIIFVRKIDKIIESLTDKNSGND